MDDEIGIEVTLCAGGGATRLVLGGALGVAGARRLLDVCRQVVDAGADTEMDLAAVASIDACVLQIMLALDDGLKKQGRALRLSRVPEGVAVSIARARLHGTLREQPAREEAHLG